MSCPTCSHTMAGLGYCDGGTIFQCERCGTVLHHNQFMDAPPRIYVPKLVERCREFQAHSLPLNLFAVWHRLGIAEAIHTPENRPA